MAIDPLQLLGGAPGGVGLPVGGAAPQGPTPPLTNALEPLSGLAAMLGATNQLSPEEQISQKLTPAIRMIHDLVSYLEQNPEIAPLAKAYVQQALGTGGKRGKTPSGTAGLTAPTPVTAGPGYAIPGFPRVGG